MEYFEWMERKAFKFESTNQVLMISFMKHGILWVNGKEGFQIREYQPGPSNKFYETWNPLNTVYGNEGF